MFEGLKDRLGIGGSSRGYDDDYQDEYDDYDEYEEADEGSDADGGYDPYSSVTTRRPGTNRPYRTSYTSRAETNLSERRSSASHPPLVSRSDVRQSGISSSTSSSYSSRRRGNSFRNSVGRASDFTPSGAEYDGIPASQKEEQGEAPAASSTSGASTRQGGYNSLFDSSPTRAALQPDRASSSTAGRASSTSTGSTRTYDPYRAYEGAGAASHKPTREVIVLSPVDYGEVESVARSLKAGDAVVLSLHNTPNQLSKRVLDFSFGVASALDASVDCIADKVFAITRANPLSEDEIKTLRAKGVM